MKILTNDQVQDGQEIVYYKNKKLCVGQASVCPHCDTIQAVNEVAITTGTPEAVCEKFKADFFCGIVDDDNYEITDDGEYVCGYCGKIVE